MKASSKQNHFDIITSKHRWDCDYNTGCIGRLFLPEVTVVHAHEIVLIVLGCIISDMATSESSLEPSVSNKPSLAVTMLLTKGEFVTPRSVIK